MFRSRWTAGRRIATLAALLLLLLGCRLPAIDPTGERIFVPGASTTLATPDFSGCRLPNAQPAYTLPADPPPCPEALSAAPNQPGCAKTHPPREGHAFYGPHSGEKLGRIVVTPGQLVAPVGSEVVLIGGLCDPNGHLVVNEPIEWILSQESVGHFVDVGEPGTSLFPPMLNTGSRKITASYALGRTAGHTAVLTRGTAKPEDDFLLKRGQNWISVTSPTEGVSHVTVWAPKAHGWDLRRQTATVHWVDAQWALPGPTVIQAGQRAQLRTRVTRTAGGAAMGWSVRYEILDGAPAQFLPTGATVVEVPVDQNGEAVAELTQTTPGPLTARVKVQILRRGTTIGDPARVVGEGFTTVTWSASGLIVRVTGPQQAGVGEVLTFRVEVSNPGDLYSHSVVLRDVRPPTLEFLNSTPPGGQRGDYAEWLLGDIGPQETRVITVNCRATREGLMRYCFRATAEDITPQEGCADVNVSTPRLSVRVSGPETAQVGERVTFDIDVTNTGTLPLTGVVLTDTFDPGLQHEQSNTGAIQLPIGTLAAGATRSDLAITFTVVAPGRHCHTIEAVADGGHRAGVQKCLNAVPATAPPAGTPATPPQTPAAAPELDVRKRGPRDLEVGNSGRFVIEIRNTGSVPITNVRIVDRYDAGLQPTDATTGAVLEQNRQAVAWTLREIPPGAREIREVVCRAVAPGNAVGEVTVSSESGITETASTTTSIAGPRGGGGVDLIPPATPNGPDTPMTGRLEATIIQLDRPTAVGNVTRVLVSLKNDRNESDRNVAVTIELPEGFRLQGVKSPGVNHNQVGNRIRFEPIRELRAGEDARYEISFTPSRAGTFNLKATIESVLTREPIERQSGIDVNARN